MRPTGAETRIYRNTSTPGTISFDAPVDLGAGGSIAAIGDLDNDGKPEIVYASGGMKIFKNISTPGSLSAASFQGPHSVCWRIYPGEDRRYEWRW
ncbi:MAG: VCBS repeat-containing protein [Bacteroidota bacterium]